VRSNNKGLTLVELMVAMAISLAAFGVIYQAYAAQQRARTREQLVVDMQQNARAAMAFMRRELRMAGFDPRAVDGIDNDSDGHIDESGESADTGFDKARHHRVRFTLDLNGDGDDNDANEDIEYRFEESPDDENEDGIADAGAATLKRASEDGESLKNFAFDIVAVAFAYAFDDDGDGALDTYPGPPEGIVIWAYDSDPPGDDDLDSHLDTNTDGVIDASDAAGGGSLGAQQHPVEQDPGGQGVAPGANPFADSRLYRQ
jgi:type IV pilus assembly protein PilW